MGISKNKTKLLVIAPSLPRYDRNSGDHRLFKILSILSQTNKITYYSLGDIREGVVEEERYRSALENLDITIYDKDHSLFNILKMHEFDAAIIEFYDVAGYCLPVIKIVQSNCPVIIDSVDLHYRRAFMKYSVTKSGDDYDNANKIKENEIKIYEMADMVITVTDEEAYLLREESKKLRIRTIPNIHELQIQNGSSDKHNLLFVGGFSHEPNIDAVSWFCDEIFPDILNEIPNAKLTVVGSDPPDQILNYRSDSIIILGYVPSLAPIFRENYISIAPLRYGAGMKGKIGEAMAYGLPVVTTHIGAQGMDLVHRVNAMVSDSPSDFSISVIELIKNDTLYNSIRQNATQHVTNISGVESITKIINSIIDEIKNVNINPLPLAHKVKFLTRYMKTKLFA